MGLFTNTLKMIVKGENTGLLKDRKNKQLSDPVDEADLDDLAPPAEGEAAAPGQTQGEQAIDAPAEDIPTEAGTGTQEQGGEMLPEQMGTEGEVLDPVAPVEAPENIPGALIPDHLKIDEDPAPNMDGDIKSNVNPKYIDSTEEAKAWLQTATSERPVVSNKETAAQAAKDPVWQDVKKLINAPVGTAWNRPQLLAGRQLLVRTINEVDKLARKVGRAQATDEDKAKLIRLHTTQVAIQRALEGGIAEAGRTLQSLKIMADPTSKMRMEQIHSIIQDNGGKNNVDTIAQAYMKSMDDALANGEDGIAAMAAAGKKMDGIFTKAIKVYNEMWINNILSGVSTFTVNLTGSMAQLYETAAVKPLAAGIGVLRGAKQGERVGVDELIPEFVGKVQGMIDSILLLTKTPRKYVDIMEQSEMRVEQFDRKAISADYLAPKIDPTGWTAVTINATGKVIRAPGTVLGVADELMKNMIYRGELNSLAIRQANLEGGTRKEIEARAHELMAEPSLDMHNAAVAEAARLTYTTSLSSQEGAIVWLGSTIQRGTAMYPIMKTQIPFIRTPTNLFNYMLETSAAGPFTKKWQTDYKQGGIAKDKAIARFTIAIASTYAIYQLVMNGQMTGRGPKDYRARKILETGGNWQQSSILVDGTWYKIDRLDPTFGDFALTATAIDMARYAETDELREKILFSSLMATTEQLMDKSYVTGLSDLFTILGGGEDAERALRKTASNKVSNMQPFAKLTKGMAKAADPVARDTRNKEDIWQQILNEFAAQVPGWSDTVPARLDWRGQPMIYEGGAFARMASPVKMMAVKGDKASVELVNNDIIPQEMSHNMVITNNFKLNLLQQDPEGHLYNKYKQFVGVARYDTIKKTINHKDYKNLTSGIDSEQASILSTALQAATKQGRYQFLEWYMKNSDKNGWDPITEETLLIARDEQMRRAEQGLPPAEGIQYTGGKRPGAIPQEVRDQINEQTDGQTDIFKGN